MEECWTYSRAGVDRRALSELHEIARLLVGRRPRILMGPGGYAGIVKEKGQLIALHIDGVGTKVLLAKTKEDFKTIGIDAVAMNVNDIICVGARPVAVVDYITLSRPMPDIVEAILSGVIKACRESGAELVGGETAILPDLFASEQAVDVAAACIGLVSKRMLLPKPLKPGDILVGLPSNGLHANGFSLVRRLLLREKSYNLDDFVGVLGRKLRDELMRPTRIYVKQILGLIREGLRPKAIAHITGSGFLKCRRIAGKGISLHFDSLPEPPTIFKLIMNEGNISFEEMYSTFNMGVGMVLVFDPRIAESAVSWLRKRTDVWVVGRVEKGSGIYVNGRLIGK